MSILIKSREDLHVFLKQEESSDYNVILITDPRLPPISPTDWLVTDNLHVGDIKRNCQKELLHLVFHDFEFKSEGSRVVLPTEDDVKSALDWAVGKEKIAIACMGGVSRSSAIAVLVVCARSTLDEAMGMLIDDIHWPNKLIIKHGSKLLNIPEINDRIQEWKDRQRR